MSFPEALALALFSLLFLFGLLFVLAGVEGRLFDQVMEEPDAGATPQLAVETAPELSQAA